MTFEEAWANHGPKELIPEFYKDYMKTFFILGMAEAYRQAAEKIKTMKVPPVA